MKWSRIAAVLIVIAATLWIGSGMYGHGGGAASTKSAAAPEVHPRFKVAVLQVRPEMHVKTITLSGRTEAEVERIASLVPLKRLAEPEDHAQAMLFLASDSASYLNGITLDVNGGRVMM